MIKKFRNFIRIKRRDFERGSFFYKLNIYYELYISEKIQKKKKSYSQWGEDLEIYNYLKNEKVCKIYVDIGAFHPTKHSNTQLLYLNGWRGYNFDINQYSIDLFRVARPKDQNINKGLSDKVCLKEIYISNYINEQNSIERDNYLNFKNQKLKKTNIEISILSKEVNENFSFLNIDAEGEDFKILQSINFEKYTPKLICCEISKLSEEKLFFNFLKKKNYIFYKKFNISYLFIRFD
jgi:hypothetical protein